MRLSKKSAALIGALSLVVGLTACGSDDPESPSGETTTGGEATEETTTDDAPETTFPEHDITLIVHAAAGGGSDLASRTLAAQLEPILGVNVIVENRPGAGGSVAMEYMADQDPDGYTIGFAPVEIAMLGSQGYDIDPDNYDFLGQIMLGPAVLAVPADSPYTTLEEFVAAAGENDLTVANSGAGAIWDIATSAFAQAADISLTPVPFDGGAPAVAAAVGSQVDAVIAGAGEVAQPNTDGTLRALAVLNDESHPLMPDVPTAAEAGFDVVIGGWGGTYAPAGLPDDVKSILADAIEQGATSDEFTEVISNAGSLPVYKSAADFTQFVHDEAARFAELLAD